MHKKQLLITTLLFLFMVLSYIPFDFGLDSLSSSLLQSTLIRVFAGAAFCVLLYAMDWKAFQKINRKDLIFILPALLVALNNFPLSAWMKSQAYITESKLSTVFFFLDALSTGFLEELIFRYIILNAILLRLQNTKRNVILSLVLSSVIFSLMHALNIFTGMGVLDVLLQMGYAFLIGMMFGAVYLLTGNIIYSMALHAIYNMTGLFFVTLGVMYNRYDLFTITSTIITSIIAFILYMYWFTSKPLKPNTIN